MELLYNPQIHSTFASLGSMEGETYICNSECMSVLEEINYKLSMEDHTLRTYRRAIGFGQNVKKDIMPLLINVKDTKVADCAIRLLVNLTVPIECLLSVEVMSRTEIGRHTIYELNRLLYTSKEIFVDLKATKAIIDHMKLILENDHKLSLSQCESINNCLLLLRNILHIPENTNQPSHTSMQNQILWNLFTQSIDKLLIHLMSCPQKSFWGVTIVQLIALMYKDQHVGTLQKLLNHWFEATSHTESSENESNTSPGQCASSSPMLTSDPTSDSSDNCSGQMTKMSDQQDSDNNRTVSGDYQSNIIRVKPKLSSNQKSGDSLQSTSFDSNELSNDDIIMKSPLHSPASSTKNAMWCPKSTRNQPQSCSSNSSTQKGGKKQRKSSGGKQMHSSNNQSELSDCGYGTQVSQGDLHVDKNQESISTSSNDDDSPQQKPAHQKPPSTNQKQRFNAAQKQRNATTLTSTPAKNQEKRRKKLVKRSKSSINMKCLIHHSPTDDDISNILKEFTVDFLLKGYGFLVQELHSKLLTDSQLSIDTSHFFWLVTYFLKFAAQLELDLEHINSVLSFELVSYLTFEGVNLCEQLELSSRQQGGNLKPYLRRIHLVVTAIREFLQALDVYKRSSHLSLEDKEHIQALQHQIGRTENLRHLFVLLLRCYNPALQSRQYLQDLVVTNHILLLLLDNVSKHDEPTTEIKLTEHIKQFATVDIMHQYGILLENFRNNGEFVNDCIFTMLHHVGGDLNQVSILFQPKILKIFSRIWETEYQLCDDWSDLIEYVIHKFINMPPKPQIALSSPVTSEDISINDIWSQEEMDTLYWYFVQGKKSKDIVGSIINQIKETGQKMKSRIAIIQQLLQQDIITLTKFDDLMKFEDTQYEREVKTTDWDESPSKIESGIDLSTESSVSTSSQPDDIKLLRNRLLKENKGKFVCWLQQVLIECCYIKLTLKEGLPEDREASKPIMEPIPYHCILTHQSIPLVPFNAEQNKILVYQPFVLLLHKLGFHLPADANKLFVRIPEFWTADILFMVAEKLGPIQKKTLKFSINRIQRHSNSSDSDFYCDLPNSPGSVEALGCDLLRSKSSNIFAGCTPDTPANSPNWLQIVIQSKTPIDGSPLVSPQPMIVTSPTELAGIHNFLQPFTPRQHQKRIISSLAQALPDFENDIIADYAISLKSLNNLDLVASEAIADSSETASVASTLTCMNVSEEGDKLETSSMKSM